MVGDLIEVTLQDPQGTEPVITGEVTAVFDALTSKGKPGINLEIDIRYGKNKTQWFRYKPQIDGGTIRIFDSEVKEWKAHKIQPLGDSNE